MPTAPDLDAVKEYLGDSSYSNAEVQAALDAETAAQSRVVRFSPDPDPPAAPLPYPVDLAEALKRRVARHLALKGLPLGYQQSASDFGPVATRVGSDLEIRRLEGPWRKVVVG